MFKVLLVDDEVFIRKGLIEIIPWGELGLVIVGEANNGEEAIQLIEQLKPDLVITDIRMPIIDGLHLIRHVKESTLEEPVFIIISGYHDFKYAHKALRYKVHDYILKPIDEDEMTATLRKITHKLEQKRNIALVNHDYMNSSIMETLVQGNLCGEKAEEYVGILGLKTFSCFLYVLIEFHTTCGDGQISIRQFQEILRPLKDMNMGIPVLEQQAGKFGVLLGVEHAKDSDRMLLQKLNQLHEGFSDQWNNDFSIYAGSSVDSIIYVHESYLEANEAARHKYAENNSIILYQNIKDKPVYVFDMPPELSSNLIMQLEEGNKEQYLCTIETMFQLFHNQRFTPQAVSGSLSRCITGVISVIREMDGSDEELRQLKNLADHIHGNWSFQRLQQHFILAMNEVEEYLLQLRKERSKGSIHQIKKYIDAHYDENISLKVIAAQFYMNAVYLGRLFRKHYGVYFNEYLLEIRIQQAKKLLRQSNLRMYEIAYKVGFQNADYFVTQFEKVENMTPTAYRSLLTEQDSEGMR